MVSETVFCFRAQAREATWSKATSGMRSTVGGSLKESKKSIARALGLDVRTVRKILRQTNLGPTNEKNAVRRH